MSRPRSSTLSSIALVAALFLGLALAAGLQWPTQRADAPAVLELPAPARPAVRKAAELSEAFTAIAEAVTPAVVRIRAEHFATPDRSRSGLLPPGLRDLFGLPPDHPSPRAPQLAGGTGFLVSSDGYILTNNHVIEGADRITVQLVDKREFEARVVGRDPTTDVAVIRVDAERLPAIRLGDSEAARVGEWVLAIGNPGFQDESTLEFTVTSGIISAKGRPLNIIPRELNAQQDSTYVYAIEDFIQTDAVINPGNSGGPLVDLQGEVIGINTAIASSSGSYEGYGFAIPINLAQRVMRDLIEHGYVRRALLGINIRAIEPEDAEQYGLRTVSGVLVEDFAPGSPAREAGIRRHDVIVALGDSPVDRVGQLQRLVAQHSPGDDVAVTVVRFGEQRRFEVRLTEAELAGSAAPATAAQPRLPAPRDLGLELADVDAEIAARLGLPQGDGVVVTAVDPAGAARRKGVVPGDRLVSINAEELGSAREARGTLRALRSGQIASLVLLGLDERTRIANVRVP